MTWNPFRRPKPKDFSPTTEERAAMYLVGLEAGERRRSYAAVKLAHAYPWLSLDEAVVYDGARRKLTVGRVLELAKLAERTHVDVWCYWRIARDGTPTVSICDDPMSHPHAHLVRIPIPDDVQKCIVATKNPPLCLVVGKHGEPTGPCPEKETP